MNYFTFKPQFHPFILSGVKVSTIREKQKVDIGEVFALRYWTGRPYNSKMGFLGAAICDGNYPIIVYADRRMVRIGLELIEDNKRLERLATQEGFTACDHFFNYFKRERGAVFIRHLTHWRSFEATKRGAN